MTILFVGAGWGAFHGVGQPTALNPISSASATAVAGQEPPAELALPGPSDAPEGWTWFVRKRADHLRVEVDPERPSRAKPRCPIAPRGPSCPAPLAERRRRPGLPRPTRARGPLAGRPIASRQSRPASDRDGGRRRCDPGRPSSTPAPAPPDVAASPRCPRRPRVRRPSRTRCRRHGSPHDLSAPRAPPGRHEGPARRAGPPAAAGSVASRKNVAARPSGPEDARLRERTRAPPRRSPRRGGRARRNRHSTVQGARSGRPLARSPRGHGVAHERAAPRRSRRQKRRAARRMPGGRPGTPVPSNRIARGPLGQGPPPGEPGGCASRSGAP